MLPENLKKQLALAVRCIQWSYAIFWSVSASQTGVLEWGDGYYNGDIKTRKTSQAVELDSHQIGLQRSEQLRELYESLATAESSPQARRPSAALSPEDLTDTEWYYLVCMSFAFDIGQGLPGRTLADGQPIWLCNAHLADCRVFSRSLLAKSASIQTVVCFPFRGGVIELGATDQVSEDLGLIQHVRTSFLDILDCRVPYTSAAAFNGRNDKDDHAFDVKSTPEIGYEVANPTSPNSSSNAFQANQIMNEPLMVERINGGVSQVQSWQVMDDEFSNVNSSDCISQSLVAPENIAVVAEGENPVEHCAQDLQECNNTNMTLMEPQKDDQHYQEVLSLLLKSSDQLIMGLHFQNGHKESSFASWKKGASMGCQRPRGGTPQKLLKKILLEVPRMHLDGLLESEEENEYKEGMRPEIEEIGTNHVLSERRRRAKLNERFLTLRSIVPSISKDDKVSILDDVIDYLKKLEKRVRELEARREVVDVETRSIRTPQDLVERTSDNYFNNKTDKKRPMLNKRKACDIDETAQEIDVVVSKDSSSNNVCVGLTNNEVLIEMKCSWREGALLEIMETVSSLHLDFASVQSSTADGNLNLTIKSKFTGSTAVSPKKIRQTLQKVIWKC